MSVFSAILECVHKNGFFYPGEGYFPIHCGKRLSLCVLPIPGDDTGDNISEKNGSYCELTALYWAWKNLDAQYYGLCHYRRYFDFGGTFNPWRTHRVMRPEDVCKRAGVLPNWADLGEHCDVVLPRPDVLPYSVEVDYAVHCMSEDFRVLRRIIGSKFPEYLQAFETVAASNKFSHYNMFVMPKAIYSNYCQWLFAVLYEVEKEIDISGYSIQQKRIFGYMGERLLNVYVQHQKLKCRFYPVLFVDEHGSNDSFLKILYARVRAELSFFFQRPFFSFAFKR